jgi:hypothetical protein
MRLPTRSFRATVVQEARVVLEPEDAPEGTWRRVQLVVPMTPRLYGGIDVPIQGGFYYGMPRPVVSPAEGALTVEQLEAMGRVGAIRAPHGGIGANRNYTVPVLAPGQTISFDLRPEQWITAMADEGIAYLTLIVQYLERALEVG